MSTSTKARAENTFISVTNRFRFTKRLLTSPWAGAEYSWPENAEYKYSLVLRTRYSSWPQFISTGLRNRLQNKLRSLPQD
jgi:hypothetical protein